MAVGDETIELLSLPTKAVDVFRTALEDTLNIEASAFAAHAVFLIIAVAILWYCLPRSRNAEKRLLRLMALVGVVVSAVWSITIIYNWIDYWRSPLAPQLIGSVSGAPVGQVAIVLLSYRLLPIATSVDKDTETGRFSVTYEPGFADPPAALAAQAPGCADFSKPLGRAELRNAAPIRMELICGQEE